MQKAILILVILLKYGVCYTQVKKEPVAVLPVHPADTIVPVIHIEDNTDSIRFSADLRPLRQVAGAPAAFYSYFWELGDGSFSFDRSPVHTYKDTGTYDVRLYATNNYDDGKAPPTRPRPVKIKSKPSSASWASHFFRTKGNIEMKINRNPKPGEDFVAILGYRNQLAEKMEGSLILFYNERQFTGEGFSLTDKRTYSGEDSSSLNSLMAGITERELANRQIMAGPDDAIYYENTETTKSMLQMLQNNYVRNTVWKFSNVNKENEHFVFMTLNTLPEMIQDTNATVTMTAMLVPDNPSLAPELFELEMEIVASHDPNRLQLRKRRINYRFMGKKKEMTYKVRFQNTGRGPAKKVSIGIAIPRQLNTSTIQIKSMEPFCTMCDSAYGMQSCIDTVRTSDSVHFIFNNIYLPGLQQDGVSDKDSTKGFVEYSIRFKKKPKKLPFSSRASIVFDKNEPIYTNRSTARFIKGISPGIVAGYYFPASSGFKGSKGALQIGFTLAPYAPSKPYFQIEAYAGLFEKQEFTTGIIQDKRDTSVNGQVYLISGRETKTRIERNNFQLVPFHYRYNINGWIGAGIGVQGQVSISEKTTVEKKAYLSGPQRPGVILTTVSSIQNNGTEWFATVNAAPFADLQIGKVKSGPALGLRYLRNVKGDSKDRFFLYASFRL